jgi:rhodanese-related sulfurtransferase
MKNKVLLTALTVAAGTVLVTSSVVLANCGKCEGVPEKGTECGKGVCPVKGEKCTGGQCAVKPEQCKGGVCASKPEAQAEVKVSPSEKIPTLGVNELETLLKAKTPLVLLDARSGKWDDGRRLPGAKALNAASTKEEVEAVIPDKSALVVTYCANLKCKASPLLAEHLKKLGYENVMELPVGIDGWVEAGKEVVKPSK